MPNNSMLSLGPVSASPVIYTLPSGAVNPGERFGAPSLGSAAEQQQAQRFRGANVGVNAGRLSLNAFLNKQLKLQQLLASLGIPIQDGQLNLSASTDQNLRPQNFNADYYNGPFSAGVSADKNLRPQNIRGSYTKDNKNISLDYTPQQRQMMARLGIQF